MHDRTSEQLLFLWVQGQIHRDPRWSPPESKFVKNREGDMLVLIFLTVNESQISINHILLTPMLVVSRYINQIILTLVLQVEMDEYRNLMIFS